INPKGVEYYNNLINELISYGIQPHITLYHLDLPQILEDEYGGWLNPKIIEDFTKYADVCFKEFGDRVGHWTTLNEPYMMAIASMFISRGLLFNCTVGNSSVEPYIAMHHYFLSHASAARLYSKNISNGLVGLKLNFLWAPPKTNSASDRIASKRAIDFYIGWDFIGINHYNTIYIQDNRSNATDRLTDYYADMNVKISGLLRKRGGQFYPTGYMPSNPSGLQIPLQYFKEYYGNPPVYIHENGYFVWSFVDVFEVLFGYSNRCGFVHVDVEDKQLKGQPKSSAHWYWNFLKNEKHDLVDMKIKKVPSLSKKYSISSQ
ncbi:hypothetical protein MKX01_037304, partial [Papaver californicum]